MSFESQDSRAVTLIGTLVGGICVGSIWGYLSQSIGFRANVLLQYVLFAGGSYFMVALLICLFVRQSSRLVHIAIATLGSIAFVLSMYLVYALPDVWRFRHSTAATSMTTYFLDEFKDVGAYLLLHTVIDGLIVLLLLTLTKHLVAAVAGITRPNRYV